MIHPTGRRRAGRPYCEAFPMIDVHALLAAAGDGRVYEEWQDEDGLVVGFASIQALDEAGVTLFFHFYGTRNVEAGIGSERVGIVRRKTGAHWRKPSFECPQCAGSVNRLYFVYAKWKCKTCHDLLSITQCLDPVNKALYYRDLLNSKVRRSPSTAIDRRKLKRHKAKYGKAVRLLADSTCTQLPPQFQHRSLGRWLPAGEVPTKVDRRAVGYGWIPGMRGQLAGLEPLPTAIPRALPTPLPPVRKAAQRSAAAPPTRARAEPAPPPLSPVRRAAQRPAAAPPTRARAAGAPGYNPNTAEAGLASLHIPAFGDIDLGLLKPFDLGLPLGSPEDE